MTRPPGRTGVLLYFSGPETVSILIPAANTSTIMLSTKPGLDWRVQLPSPSFDNDVTICGCSRGPLSLYRTGISPETEGLSGLRIFFIQVIFDRPC